MLRQATMLSYKDAFFVLAAAVIGLTRSRPDASVRQRPEARCQSHGPLSCAFPHAHPHVSRAANSITFAVVTAWPTCREVCSAQWISSPATVVGSRFRPMPRSCS